MALLKLKVLNSVGDTLAVSSCGTNVSLVHTMPYADGDWIALETDTAGLHCWIQLEDSMPPVLVYLARNGLDFRIPPQNARMNYSPKSFHGGCHVVRAWLPTPEELDTRRNLALNPYDSHGDHGFYPHASANIETRGEAVFAARNVIDGVYQNDAHGAWPYQSWGINRDPNACLRLEFGRHVRLDEIRLTLRADFPHDSWWTQAVVEFSDGTRETFALEKQAEPQCFSISPRSVTWLELKELQKANDASPFPALTQIEAWGTEEL